MAPGKASVASAILLAQIPWAYWHLVSWKARILLAFALFLLVVIGIVVTSLLRAPNRIRLMDGTEVLSVTAEYGTNHYAVLRQPGSGRLISMLPDKVRNLFARPRKDSTFSSPEETLVITLHTTAANQFKAPKNFKSPVLFGYPSSSVKSELIDEHGCVFRGNYSWTYANNIERACQFQFRQFPRRGTNLHFVVSGVSGEALLFNVPNPCASQAFHRWVPDGLPVSRNVGDLTFTLESIRAITDQWDRQRSLKLFPTIHLTRSGRLVEDWDLDETEMQDAQGNLGRSWCVYEPIYRILATAWPSGNAVFSPSNIFFAQEIKLPALGSFLEIRTNCQIAGLQVKLLGLAAPGTYFISNKVIVGSMPVDPARKDSWHTRNVKGQLSETAQLTWRDFRLLFKRFSMPSQCKLIFRTRNERGQLSMLATAKAGEDSILWKSFQISVPPDSQKVFLEGIVADARSTEFYVQSPLGTNSTSLR